MRLSSKVFVALAVLAGSLFGFSPDASAHRNTGSVAVVSGTVSWPGGTQASFALPHGLNGCERPGGNTEGGGLPVGTLGPPPSLFTSNDLCFEFDDLAINTVGLWDGLNHKTSFGCESTGTTGASGNDKPTPDAADATGLNTQAVALGPTFGASYGEFECVGSALPVGGFPFVANASGHFHVISVGSTTIGFLGAITCVDANEGNCPLENDGSGDNIHNNNTEMDNANPTNRGVTNPAGLGNHNVSNIKHTVACKGEVVPILPGRDKYLPNGALGAVEAVTGDTILSAAVALECIIG